MRARGKERTGRVDDDNNDKWTSNNPPITLYEIRTFYRPIKKEISTQKSRRGSHRYIHPTVIMSACARQVYPPDVIQYVKAQLKKVPDSSEAVNGNLPESMRLTDRMREENGLRDALVSSEGMIFCGSMMNLR
eukprot:scaffold2632_cov158-Amphora_coffeaeformis.AAC.2